MKAVRSLAMLAVLAAAAPVMMLSIAHADPATKPAAPARKVPKLTKPYDDIASLSDEQKFKLDDIHDVAMKEIRKIRDKEEEDSLAVLTPEQKSELKAKEEDASAKRKEKQKK